MSTHERVIRGYFAIQLDNGSVSDDEIDGIIAYIESVAGQTPPRQLADKSAEALLDTVNLTIAKRVREVVLIADAYEEAVAVFDWLTTPDENVAQSPQRPADEPSNPNGLADTKPAEQPERRERWYVWFPDGKLHFSYLTKEEAREAAQRINGTYCLVREVLPGDPSPWAVAEVVKQLRSVASSPPAWSKHLNALADTLEGK